jgi:Leucine-rich repeat (LRR) protein
VSQNDLVELPKELVDLPRLEFLDVWSNELETVPKEYKGFKNLKKVDLRVILLSDSQKDEIQKNFPTGTEVMFSPGCNCGN